MNLDYLEQLFPASTTLRLLRSDNAPLIISFLYKVFKSTEKISLNYSYVLEALQGYLDDLPDNQRLRYSGEAVYYLNQWCDEDHQYLRRYYESKDEPLLELTAGTEKVIGWLMDLDKQEFIGTESRFIRIFELLKDIIRNTATDPQARLKDLLRQRALIEQEIDGLKENLTLPTFSKTQIRERFYLAGNEAKKLVADFREVEVNFKELTQTIQETALLSGRTKGSIVNFVLDADDALKESDQGKSFYAFWNFLLSPSLQEELRELTEQVYSLQEISELAQADQFLRRLKYHLLEAGDKVLRSNHRLAEQLRRTIAERALNENRRAAELIEQIKKRALRLKNTGFTEKEFIQMEDTARLEMNFDRPWWTPTSTFEFIPPGQEEDTSEVLNFSSLFRQFYVDTEQIRLRIEGLLQDRNQVSLREVIELYHPKQGISELLAYFDIASQTSSHVITTDSTFKVVLPVDCSQSHKISATAANAADKDTQSSITARELFEQLRTVNVPEIVFCREQQVN